MDNKFLWKVKAGKQKRKKSRLIVKINNKDKHDQNVCVPRGQRRQRHKYFSEERRLRTREEEFARKSIPSTLIPSLVFPLFSTFKRTIHKPGKVLELGLWFCLFD